MNEQDPQDYVFVDRPVSQPQRRSRRHLSLADTDWRADPMGEMRATITINGLGYELVAREAHGTEESVVLIAGRPHWVTGLDPLGHG